MSINFKKIVFPLFTFTKDEDSFAMNREFPEGYFLREFKKAQKEDYDAESFFKPCLKIIEQLDQETFLCYNNIAPYEEYDLIKNYAEHLCDQGSEDSPISVSETVDNKKVVLNFFPYEVVRIKAAIKKTYQKALEEEKFNVIGNIPSVNLKNSVNTNLDFKPEYRDDHSKVVINLWQLEGSEVEKEHNSNFNSDSENEKELDEESSENGNGNSDVISFEKKIEEISSLENKFWRGFLMKDVINHFEKLTTQKNKNKEFYLTKAQFISFIKRGFLADLTQPIQKINCIADEKGKVIKLFYLFYDKAVSLYKHPRKKEKFIKLFIDCFDNWDENTVKSCFRRDITKENW
jgi:hypothetical protein